MYPKHCIILAAGKNSRLDTGKPKSLLEINGITLLERHVRNFRNIGVNHFCIVTGHNPNPIRDMVPSIAASYDVKIDLVHNERFDLENGYSLSVTQKWIDGNDIKNFILTMGDHAFQLEFIQDFRQKIYELDVESKLILAVDIPGDSNNHIDLDDVTKVLSNEQNDICAIGKNIAQYNRFDTGLFLLSYEIFPVLNECFDQNKFTLSDMVSALIAQKEARTVELPGFLWNDVDNPDDLNNTIRLGMY